MKKKFIFVGILLGVCLIIIAATLILTRTTVVASPDQGLEECTTLQYNSESAINLVFFAEREMAQEYTDYLFQYEPFASTQNRFNVYLIDAAKYQPKCELYRGIAYYCYNRELVKKAASCPNDYIIVLGEQPRSIRSSAYKGVMSLNTNVPKTVLLHEMAHAISYKAEEYSAPGASIPRNADNCVASCEDFGGINQDCEQECTSGSLYRSYENGLMRTLYPDTVTYGAFNEQTMKQDIIEQSGGENPARITGNVIATPRDCAQEKYTLVTTQFESGKLSVKQKTSEIGCAPGLGYKGPNEITFLDNQGEIIIQANENLETLFNEAQNENQETIHGEPINLPDTEAHIGVTEETKAETLEITYNEETYPVTLQGTGATACRI